MTQAKNELARPTTRPELVQFRGTHTDAAKTTELLQIAAERFNLIAPASAVAAIPDGCAMALPAVLVDVRSSDVYPIPGGPKLGLSKPTLDRIAGGVGVTVVPEKSGRLDDGRTPNFCRYRWVGRYRQFDGTFIEIQGEKELDLRDGSATVQNMHAIARKGKKSNADAQLAQMRDHLQSHAETKARLRAIRSLGVKTSYLPEELSKPFVCARLTLTGQFRDPEARAQYNKALTDSFLGSSQAMYPAAAHALPLSTQGTSAPPLGAVPADEDDPAPSEPPPDASRESGQSSGIRHAAGAGDMRMPGKKGGTIAQAEYDDLVFWREKIPEGLAKDPNGQYAARNREQLAMIVAEIEARDAPETIDEGTGEITEDAPGGKVIDAKPEWREPPRPPHSHELEIGKGAAGEGKKFADASDDELLGYLEWMKTKLRDEGGKWNEKGVTGAKFKIAQASAEIDWRMEMARKPKPAETPATGAATAAESPV